MIGPLANHLWQSTLFAVAAALLTLAFRRNRAQVRYWLWFSASLKFLVPFALLIGLGSQIDWAPEARHVATPAVSLTLFEISEPFPTALPAATPAPTTTYWLLIVIVGVWACGFVGIVAMRFRRWLRIRAAVRASTPVEIPSPVPVRACPGPFEPGVLGFVRPILLVPADILERLTPPQLEAVLAHELCHIRRRDNLTAAIHIIVEAVFWFHPLVWWIGARLVEERERACDEAVLSLGSEPRDYAEAILNVLKLYVGSPLVCVSAVTGADIRKRVEAILTRPIARNLDFARKLLLATAGIAAVVTPVTIGLLHTTPSQAQSPTEPASPISYVASIKPNRSAEVRGFSEYYPGGRFSATAITPLALMRLAYRLQDYQFVGVPAWFSTRRYDIAAKAESNPPPSQQIFLQTLLKDRFQLATHNEKRELPVFALVPAGRNGNFGPQLTKSDFDCAAYLSRPHDPPQQGRAQICATNIRPGALSARAIPMAQLALSLAPFVHRFTVDRTGLTGRFDVELTWTPEQPNATLPDTPPADSPGISIFTAIQEQLGLKLVPEKGPVEVLVVDRADEPTEN